MIINLEGKYFASKFLEQNRIKKTLSKCSVCLHDCLFLKVIQNIITITVLFLVCTLKNCKGNYYPICNYITQRKCIFLFFQSLQRMGFLVVKRTGAEDSFVLSQWALFQVNFFFSPGNEERDNNKKRLIILDDYYQSLKSKDS